MTTPTPSASQTASADAGKVQTPTVETVRKWKERAERRFMISSLDEYCPDEFLELADAYIALAALRQTSIEPVAWRWNRDMSRLPAAQTLLFLDPVDEDGGQQVRLGLSTDAMNAEGWSYLPGEAPAAPEHAASERGEPDPRYTQLHNAFRSLIDSFECVSRDHELAGMDGRIPALEEAQSKAFELRPLAGAVIHPVQESRGEAGKPFARTDHERAEKYRSIAAALQDTPQASSEAGR